MNGSLNCVSLLIRILIIHVKSHFKKSSVYVLKEWYQGKLNTDLSSQQYKIICAPEAYCKNDLLMTKQ